MQGISESFEGISRVVSHDEVNRVYEKLLSWCLNSNDDTIRRKSNCISVFTIGNSIDKVNFTLNRYFKSTSQTLPNVSFQIFNIQLLVTELLFCAGINNPNIARIKTQLV